VALRDVEPAAAPVGVSTRLFVRGAGFLNSTALACGFVLADAAFTSAPAQLMFPLVK
jgi:hypothetical protein